MAYTVHELARIAGVSVRTLHHYDNIGVLKPGRNKQNRYRFYGEAELLRLQQILFFRELEFPLGEIKRIMARPGFDMRQALRDQRKLINLRKKRLTALVATIDKTLKKLNRQKNMPDEELYNSFSNTEAERYAAEAKERWGHTEAYQESQKRTKHFTKEDWQRVKEHSDILMKKIVGAMSHGPQSREMQRLIGEHYESLRTYYEPNIALYRGLADMYVQDPCFTAFYERYASGLATIMNEAMHYYCDVLEEKR